MLENEINGFFFSIVELFALNSEQDKRKRLSTSFSLWIVTQARGVLLSKRSVFLFPGNSREHQKPRASTESNQEAERRVCVAWSSDHGAVQAIIGQALG